VKLFISYSHQDKATAAAITKSCVTAGMPYFQDEKDVMWGDSISAAVARGLSDSTHLLVIVSPATVKSWWVPFEIGRAVERHMTILPYLTHPSLELQRHALGLRARSTRGRSADAARRHKQPRWRAAFVAGVG